MFRRMKIEGIEGCFGTFRSRRFRSICILLALFGCTESYSYRANSHAVGMALRCEQDWRAEQILGARQM